MPETENQNKLLQENNRLLNNIFSIIHKDERSQTMEIITAVLLALATVASAWCAYQSTLWGGVQTFRLADEIREGRLISEYNVLNTEYRSFDAVLFIKYIEALHKNDNEIADFYFERFNPVLKKATLEWLETKPLVTENAPKSPFQMKSYKTEFEEKSEQMKIKSEESMNEAQKANEYSDKYVLLTVIFSSVLFFGGIAGTLRSHSMRIFSIVMSAVLFFATLIVLFSMPVCNQ
ncbi:MAG: hypothetical protein JSS91_08135 [Bacteroidetes bacterium]|nr:hypothetical protein [Bacteroidota bacterium]